MKSPLHSFLALCLVWAAAVWCPLVPTLRAGFPGLPRERGAIYLEDFFEQPYRLKVLQDAAIYYNADLARFLGTLRRGQLVELQAVNDKRGLLRVRGQAEQGQVAGWIEARSVSALDPAFVVALRRSVERREQIRALTASGEIALGMTMEEVAVSLGQPLKKSSHADANGVVESWDYVRYVVVPRTVAGYDSRGRIFNSVVYERLASGKFSAAFSNGVVSAIDRSDVDLGSAGGSPVKSVPPPVGITFASRGL